MNVADDRYRRSVRMTSMIIVISYTACVVALYYFIHWDEVSARLMRYMVLATVLSAVIALVQDLGVVSRWTKLLDVLALVVPGGTLLVALAMVAPWRYPTLSSNDVFSIWMCALACAMYWGLSVRRLLRSLRSGP